MFYKIYKIFVAASAFVENIKNLHKDVDFLHKLR